MPAEFVEQRRDSRLIESCTVRDRLDGRGSSVFEVELKQRNARAIRDGIVQRRPTILIRTLT
ncbi:hypothetical protein J8J40_35065, partial [Mycobacterium tuberculosis]|nr:hypothetical protein [Mycobacterium tuberculosis]